MFLINLRVRNNNKTAVCHQHSSMAFLSQFTQEKVCLFVLSLLLIINGSPIFAQKANENSPKLLNGQILNMEDETPVANAIISNQRTKETVTADLTGQFRINAVNTDSLEISALGYSKQTISIPSNYSNSNVLIIYASTFRYLLPDVNINGNYQKPILKVEKIEVSPYFRNEFMREKPAEEKAYQNQISLLKIPLYGKEQPVRKFRNATKADKHWTLVSKIYNIELVRELTGLNATEADMFMIFLNSKQLFNKMTTKEDASFIILEQFSLYRKAGH